MCCLGQGTAVNGGGQSHRRFLRAELRMGYLSNAVYLTFDLPGQLLRSLITHTHRMMEQTYHLRQRGYKVIQAPFNCLLRRGFAL
jgi:hypothetical protein